MAGNAAQTCLALAVADRPAKLRTNSPRGRSLPPLRALPMCAKTSRASAGGSYQCADVGSVGRGLRQPSPAVGL